MAALSSGLFGAGDVAVRSTSGRSYLLRLGFRALLYFEQNTGQTALDALRKLDSGETTGARNLAMLVTSAAQEHHPDFDPCEATDILGAHPDIVLRLLVNAAPAPKAQTGDVEKHGDGGMVILDFLASWCAQGLSAAEFWGATPRTYAAVMGAASDRLRSEREWSLYCAYVGAYLGRVKELPTFKELMGRDDTPEERAARAAHQRTYLKAKSSQFKKNGQERTWAEWLQYSRA